MECPCTKSEIEVFSPVNVQVALTEGRWHTYLPLNSIENTDSVEFVIPGTATECIDMNNISLYLAGKIKRNDNAAVVAADKIQVANNFFGALFRNVDVSLNGQLITRATREYAYKDYMSKIVDYDMPKKRVQQATIAFYPDTPGKSDKLWDDQNAGAKERHEMVELSRRFEVRGSLAIDFFHCERLLFPGTDIHIKLYFNDPKFYLVSDVANKEYKLALEDVELRVRRVSIADSFINQMQTDIKTKDAIYPFTRREMTTFNIAQGLSSVNRENLFRGQLGMRYFVCLVDAGAAHGDYTKNPFELKHFGLAEIGLFENGQSIAGPPIVLDMANKKSMNAYYQLLESIGAIGERALYPPITYEDFKSHTTLFCFTRSPDLSHGEGETTLPSQVGNLTMRLLFKAPLPAAVTCFVMGEFDARVQINQYKNVVTDFAV